MASRTVAHRYAKGLLEAVSTEASGQEQALLDQLNATVEVVQGHDGLHALVVNPAIASTDKKVIFGKIGEILQASELLARFLDVLAEKERLDHLALIALVYAELVDDHLGIVDAEVTTPVPLNTGQAAELEKSLREATGAEVRISKKTDPELLGGVVTRIGDVVYDGSLRGHLARIRERLEHS